MRIRKTRDPIVRTAVHACVARKAVFELGFVTRATRCQASIGERNCALSCAKFNKIKTRRRLSFWEDIGQRENALRCKAIENVVTRAGKLHYVLSISERTALGRTVHELVEDKHHEVGGKK